MLFVNSRYVLLTYSQCGSLDPWSVSNHLSTLGAECIIGREIHPTTGGIHLHCFADFNRKFRSRSARIFDVDGRHPNVVPSRGTPEKGYDYAIKDGDVAAGGLGRPEPRGGMSRGAHAISNVAHLCEDTTEFLELYDEMDRGGLIAGFNNVRAYADWRFRPEPVGYASPDGAQFRSGATDGRDDWLVQSRIGDELPFVSAPVANAPFAVHIFCLLILYGPSLTGKTTWARSLGDHIYMQGVLSGKEILNSNESARYAVLDDIRGGLKFFPAWKDWLGGQQWISVKQMYRDPILWKWGRPCIWCANRDPRADIRRSIDKDDGVFMEDDMDWINANCIFVYVDESLVTFRAST
nr:MAG: replication-associated protein [Gemycircularvirus]